MKKFITVPSNRSNITRVKPGLERLASLIEEIGDTDKICEDQSGVLLRDVEELAITATVVAYRFRNYKE